MKAKGKTKNALEILRHRYFKSAKQQAGLEDARVNAAAARLIYQLRTDANLSQQRLADLVGTTQSVISRLEDDDYDGHSLTMLSRITTVLKKRLVLTAVDE